MNPESTSNESTGMDGKGMGVIRKDGMGITNLMQGNKDMT